MLVRAQAGPSRKENGSGRKEQGENKESLVSLGRKLKMRKKERT